MPQVQVIQPIQQQPKRLRVAAYARVSSDSEDQLNSLAVQVDYYTHLIQENPNWEFAGIYTDEGITGTSTKHREQFNRLMDDCRAGLIDRVLVKSASRFARNTADALTSVRELKSLGVTVAFEKEGFDTETSNGEMLLSIICAVAQEESLSISQNMKWGIHKRMRTGNYITNATPFGYTQINHQLVPEKNNAMIVNDIFKSYLSGMGINEIAEHLNTIYPKENRKWNPRTIHAILRNEKYIGDSLYQKTYTTDSLPLKRYLNTGQRSKYYALETHEGIISKTDYEKVQNLLAKKALQGRLIELVYFQRKSTAQYVALYAPEKGRPREDLYGAAEHICNRKLFAYSNQSVRMNSNRRFCQSIIDCNVIRKRFWNNLWMTCLGYGICKNKNIKTALHLEKIFSILQNRNTILPESIH